MFAWMRELALDDRHEAGRLLAQRLAHYRSQSPIVVGLSPGGVVVAAELAKKLDTTMDVMAVQSVGAPSMTDGVIGAVALGGVAFFEPWHVNFHRLSIADLQRLTVPAIAEVKRQTRRLRGKATLPAVRGRVVILVDDGVSSKAQMLAALWALRGASPARVVIAIGVCPPDVVKRLREDADEVYCLLEPDPMGSTSYWYRRLEPVGEDEVIGMLATAADREWMWRSSPRKRGIRVAPREPLAMSS